MKRLIILAVLCAFLLSAAAASAADIKASGAWVVEANWNDNWGFNKDVAGTAKGPGYAVSQRAHTQFEFIANENLKGVLQTRYGTEQWGQKSFAIGQGDSGTNDNTQNRISVRQAYIDFNWPDTSVHVRAGYQGVSLPAAFGGGSLVLDEEIGAAVVSGSMTDNVGYLVGYARAADGDSNTNAYIDAYIAALPMNFEGFSFAPFGMYAPIGDATNAASLLGTKMQGLAATNASDFGMSDGSFDNAYWLGAAFTMDLFDPFVLKADVNYGKVESSRKQNERSGWLFDAALEYKGFDFMTPELFFVYTSGEDGNASKGNGSSERMPVLAAQNWAIGSFFFGGDRLLMGSIQDTDNYMGFWALGLSLKDIQSFAEGLTHDVHFIYAKGTNDKDTFNQSAGVAFNSNNNFTYGRSLTEKDTLYEIDFNTGYKLYDELTLSLDLGYLNLDTKESRWGGTSGMKGGDAWKVSTGVLYKF